MKPDAHQPRYVNNTMLHMQVIITDYKIYNPDDIIVFLFIQTYDVSNPKKVGKPQKL